MFLITPQPGYIFIPMAQQYILYRKHSLQHTNK